MNIFRKDLPGVNIIRDKVEIDKKIDHMNMNDIKSTRIHMKKKSNTFISIYIWYDNEKYYAAAHYYKDFTQSILFEIDKEVQDKCIEDVRIIALNTILIQFYDIILSIYNTRFELPILMKMYKTVLDNTGLEISSESIYPEFDYLFKK